MAARLRRQAASFAASEAGGKAGGLADVWATAVPDSARSQRIRKGRCLGIELPLQVEQGSSPQSIVSAFSRDILWLGSDRGMNVAGPSFRKDPITELWQASILDRGMNVAGPSFRSAARNLLVGGEKQIPPSSE